MDGFFAPPPMITGLLGEQEAERLRKQSIGTGLVGALIGGLTAAPLYRTQGIAPILGQALSAGFQGSQNVYSNALEGYMTQQKIAEMQRQEQQRKAQEQAITDFAASNPELGQVLRAFPSAAPSVLEKMYTPSKPEKLIGNVNPSDVTPASLAKFAQSGNFQDLEFIDKTKPPEPERFAGAYGNLALSMFGTSVVSNLTAQQRQQLDAEARRRNLERPPSAIVNVGVKTGSKLGESIAAAEGQKISALYESAQGVPNTLQTIQETRKILDSGNVITGIGADARLDLARLGQLLGTGGKDNTETVANTQRLFANRAQSMLDAIKSSGLGSGQGFSNADREFLQKAKMGGIQFNEQALRRQLDIEERVSRAIAINWNKRLQKLDPEIVSTVGYSPVELPEVQVPAGTAPKGVTQQQWNVMTPEQRKLWQTR
jgi:surface antigen